MDIVDKLQSPNPAFPAGLLDLTFIPLECLPLEMV